MTTPDPVDNPSELERRKRGERRAADAVHMEWLRRNYENLASELQALKVKFEEVAGVNIAIKHQEEASLQRIILLSEALGIDERGRPVKGGIVDTFARLSGLKMAMVWMAGGVVAVMGLYSTVKEIGSRWLGH